LITAQEANSRINNDGKRTQIQRQAEYSNTWDDKSADRQALQALQNTQRKKNVPCETSASTQPWRTTACKSNARNPDSTQAPSSVVGGHTRNDPQVKGEHSPHPHLKPFCSGTGLRNRVIRLPRFCVRYIARRQQGVTGVQMALRGYRLYLYQPRSLVGSRPTLQCCRDTTRSGRGGNAGRSAAARKKQGDIQKGGAMGWGKGHLTVSLSPLAATRHNTKGLYLGPVLAFQPTQAEMQPGAFLVALM
jgi:hypothetical protein